MIIFKNTKNQPIEMHYTICHGILGITFTLPTAMSTIKQAAQIFKKSINKKLATRAYKLLAVQSKEYKARKKEVMNTVAALINGAANMTIFGKLPDTGANKTKIKALIDKV